MSWHYLGSSTTKETTFLDIPSTAKHVLCILQDDYSAPRTTSLDLYPGISKSGDYVVGAYYFNGAGLGAQIRYNDTSRKVSWQVCYVDGKMKDSGITMYVYYY